VQVTFPNGVRVRACGLEEREKNAAWRSFGLYLDERWKPSWPAVVIEWPDFGLPVDASGAAGAIRTAYRRAEIGERVEIGCAGGLGRTGTVLACMAVLSGVDPASAVNWVRAHYDRRAVETEKQAGWVQWFAQNLGAGRVSGDG
jgi:protein-tyrosine phosphatase